MQQVSTHPTSVVTQPAVAAPAAAETSPLHAATVSRPALTGEQLEEALTAARRQEQLSIRLGRALRAVHLAETFPLFRRMQVRQGIFSSATAGMLIGGCIAAAPVSTILFCAGLGLMATDLLLRRRTRNQMLAAVPQLKDRFANDDLGIAHHELLVESKLPSARGFFARALTQQLSPADRVRALMGLLACSEKSSDPSESLASYAVIGDFVRSVPLPQRDGDPSFTFPCTEGLMALSKRMHASRYDNAVGASGFHHWVNPESCKLLGVLFKYGLPETCALSPQLQEVVQELDRTVGATNPETRLALAELKGMFSLFDFPINEEASPD